MWWVHAQVTRGEKPLRQRRENDAAHALLLESTQESTLDQRLNIEYEG